MRVRLLRRACDSDTLNRFVAVAKRFDYADVSGGYGSNVQIVLGEYDEVGTRPVD